MIGQNETPHLWRESVVCGECHARLSAPVALPVPLRPQAEVASAPVPLRQMVLIAVVTALVTIIVFYFLIVWPLQEKTDALSRNLDSLTETVNHNAGVANENIGR
jgi:hypothetical protein